MPDFKYGNKQFSYKVIKSKRKTIAIQIYPDGRLLVRAPVRTRKADIQAVLEKKGDWIRKHMEAVEKAGPIAVKKRESYEDGSILLFRGREYRLTVLLNREETNLYNKRKDKPVIWTEGQHLFVKMGCDAKPDSDVIENSVLSWYKTCARERIMDRLEFFNSFIREDYGQVRIKEVKSRWGSCSSKRNLNFNWRLIKAPDVVLDYVVLHELCHLKEMNHSRQFWNHVEEVMPKYRECRNWLKVNGGEL